MFLDSCKIKVSLNETFTSNTHPTATRSSAWIQYEQKYYTLSPLVIWCICHLRWMSFLTNAITSWQIVHILMNWQFGKNCRWKFVAYSIAWLILTNQIEYQINTTLSIVLRVSPTLKNSWHFLLSRFLNHNFGGWL